MDNNEREFIYQGIRFRPHQVLPEYKYDDLVRRTHRFGLTPPGWDHSDFYKASGDAPEDLFILPELGNLVVIPAKNHLFAYRDEETEKNPVFQYLNAEMCAVKHRYADPELYISYYEHKGKEYILRFDTLDNALTFDWKEVNEFFNALPHWVCSAGYEIVTLELKQRLRRLLAEQDNNYKHAA